MIDTFKNSPLFADGLYIKNGEPIKWRSPKGKETIIFNLTNQQNMFRTFRLLSMMTGNQKYFENLQDKSGLLNMGGHRSIDLMGLVLL